MKLYASEIPRDLSRAAENWRVHSGGDWPHGSYTTYERTRRYNVDNMDACVRGSV